MPSPFPGMDPYLESPARWGTLHFLLISAANAILKPILRPRGYWVSPGERVWVTQPGRGIQHDVTVSTLRVRPVGRAASAVMEADTPVKLHSAQTEVVEPFLEILDADGGKLVTGMEIVSPWNKAAGEGRKLYRQKQRETLGAGASLVEVDLLRRGKYMLAVPEYLLEELPDWDYLVTVARASTPGDFEAYPIPMESRLPRIRIPLKPDDDDVVLDLQAVMDRAYDESPFEDRIDYTQPPHGRMSRERLAWRDELLRKKGLRQ